MFCVYVLMGRDGLVHNKSIYLSMMMSVRPTATYGDISSTICEHMATSHDVR